MRLAFALAFALLACTDNPSIDGARVGTVSPGGTCAQICARITALCGFAPADCTDDDGGGYCDLNFTQDQIDCIGTAKSCQEAWDNVTPTGCLYVAPTGDASADDAGDASSE